MRKLAIALGAIAFALGTAAIPATAATKPAKEGAAVTAPAKPKKVQVKKAKPEATAKYKAKCQAGQKWDATASLNAGACVKRTAKVKVKAAPKSAKVSKPAAKKAS